MKKCIICKSVFPKEVENIWKYTCHKRACYYVYLCKKNKEKRLAKQKLWKK